MDNPKSPIAGIFLWLAEATDGKKTLAGLLMVVGGVLTFIFTPDYKQEGLALVASGLPVLLTGLAHKAVKAKEAAEKVLQ